MATVSVDIACAVSAIVLIVLGTLVSGRLTPSFARRAAASTTYAAMILLWPIVFGCVVQFGFLDQVPLLWLSVGWPMAFLLINLVHADRPRDKTRTDRTTQQIDVNAVTGFCFAVGGMVSSQLGKTALLSVSGIFTTAFLLCLAFVLPTPDLPAQTHLHTVIDVIQSSFLQYAIGLIIAGILLNLQMGRKFAGRRSSIIKELLNAPVDEIMKRSE